MGVFVTLLFGRAPFGKAVHEIPSMI